MEPRETTVIATPPAALCPADRPLLVTDDPALLDDLVRLAVAAGVEPCVAATVTAARATWAGAPLVLVGADVVAQVAAAGLPRRPHVVVVTDPAGAERSAVWARAVEAGAEKVVILPEAEAWLVDQLADAAERTTAGPLVAVVGGRGGAGASTLAACLAATARHVGHTAVLIDGDPLGGGIDLVLGGEEVPGLRWGQLAAARGRLSSDALAGALPQVSGLPVLAWDRGVPGPVPAAAMAAVLPAARRGHELVVVDLPRRLDEAAQLALDAATVTLLLLPAELRGVAAARQVLPGLLARCADVRLVVRGPAPGGLRADDIAAALELPLAGRLRPEPGLAAALERGDPPPCRGRGPLASFCRTFLAMLGLGGVDDTGLDLRADAQAGAR